MLSGARTVNPLSPRNPALDTVGGQEPGLDTASPAFSDDTSYMCRQPSMWDTTTGPDLAHLYFRSGPSSYGQTRATLNETLAEVTRLGDQLVKEYKKIDSLSERSERLRRKLVVHWHTLADRADMKPLVQMDSLIDDHFENMDRIQKRLLEIAKEAKRQRSPTDSARVERRVETVMRPPYTKSQWNGYELRNSPELVGPENYKIKKTFEELEAALRLTPPDQSAVDRATSSIQHWIERAGRLSGPHSSIARILDEELQRTLTMTPIIAEVSVKVRELGERLAADERQLRTAKRNLAE